MILGVVSFGIAGPIIYFSAKKSYTAVAELRVDPDYRSVTPGFDSGYNSIGQFYNEYVSTQKFKILKRQNIERALLALDPSVQQILLKGKPITEENLNNLANAIWVQPAADSLILTLVLSGGQPAGLAEFLNSLVDVYLEELKNELSNKESTRISYAEKMKLDLEQKIEELNQRLRLVSEAASTGNFNSEDIPYKLELKNQEQEAIKAENDRILKEKQYNEYVKNIEQLKSLGSAATVDEKVRTDPYLAETRRSLMNKLDPLTTQLNNMLPSAPGRKELEENIQKINQQLLDSERATREKYKKMSESENAAVYEKQRMDLYMQYTIAKQYEDAVKESFRNVRGRYSSVSKLVLEGKNLEEDLSKLKDQLQEVNSTLTLLQGEQLSRGYVTVENYAKTPIQPDRSSTFKNLLIALIASFGWVIGLVFLLELLDQRVKSAEELRTFAGFKPSWPISHYAGDFLTISQNDSEAGSAKAIKSLAIRLNQERQKFQTKVVCFAGVNRHTGATEILLNAAHEMVANCEKVLVVDFQFDNPEIAKKLGFAVKDLPWTKDFNASVLERSVISDNSRGIDVLAFRNLESLDNKTIDQILERARELYDIVLVDVPPILSSSESEHIFSVSDTVVFIVQGYKSKYPDILHSLELATKFGVSSVAMVLNWWKPNANKSASLPRVVEPA